LVLAEAQAHGLPIVVNRWGPFPELYVGGKDACFYVTDSIASLVAALGGLLTDRAAREALGRAARANFERVHSLSARGADLQTYFRELV
jgi:glycosyltransferase involved in cell wall biosynthesis